MANFVQIHKSFVPAFANIEPEIKLIDFTEAKLKKLLSLANYWKQKQKLLMILNDYVAGKIGVRWVDGLPVSISIPKNNKKQGH